jgi:hypothetical protein
MDDSGIEEDINMTPEIEAALSLRLAQAAQQLLQQNQNQQKQAQAAQQAQDPIIQMQQKELELKAQEQQRKAQKDQTDAQLKLKQLEIEAQRIQSQAATAQAQISATTAGNAQKIKAQQLESGAKLAIDAINRERQHNHAMTAKSYDHASKRELTPAQQSLKKETK